MRPSEDWHPVIVNINARTAVVVVGVKAAHLLPCNIGKLVSGACRASVRRFLGYRHEVGRLRNVSVDFHKHQTLLMFRIITGYAQRSSMLTS